LDRLNTNTQIAKEIKITQIFNKLLEYKRKWIQHVSRMLVIGCPGYWNTIPQLAEGIIADLWRDFWIRETGTGQPVAHLHDIYDDDDDDDNLNSDSFSKK
jgi:hypothetical protein